MREDRSTSGAVARSLILRFRIRPEVRRGVAAVQVRACLHAVCKTVGSAYVGSNPTPATTPATPCGNGPLAAETRPGGPFTSCHVMYQGVSLWVDAWQ
jgi:hypothetical protein